MTKLYLTVERRNALRLGFERPFVRRVGDYGGRPADWRHRGLVGFVAPRYLNPLIAHGLFRPAPYLATFELTVRGREIARRFSLATDRNDTLHTVSREMVGRGAMTISELIDGILEREGWPAYTNRKNDRGGPTKGGITLKTLRAFRKDPNVTVFELQELSEDEARLIYEWDFVELPGYVPIRDALLKTQVVDCAVLHGPGTATRLLQKAANRQRGDHPPLKVDGICGPKTLARANYLAPRDLWNQLAAQRIRYIGRIITQNHKARRAGKTETDDAENAAGWLNRAASFIA